MIEKADFINLFFKLKMTRNILLSLIVLVLLIGHVHSYTNANPGWLANPYFDAGNKKVINGDTVAGQIRTHNFNYAKPFPGVPGLCYGIKSYRGKILMI